MTEVVQETWQGGRTFYADFTLTQANAAGGAVKVDIPCTAGQEMLGEMGTVINSGTNGIIGYVEQGAAVGDPKFINVASGAGTAATWPQTNSQAASSTTVMDSSGGIWIHGAGKFVLEQTAAGAQNDTFRIIAWFRCKAVGPGPVSFARSTNAANVSVTAGSSTFVVV